MQAAGELGRLQITSLDSAGRISAVASLHLLLLSSGENQITPTGDLQESVLLDSPRRGGEISGGEVKLSGQMRPFNGQPVIIELVTKDGNGAQLACRSPECGRWAVSAP